MPAEKRSAEQDPQDADPSHKRVDRGEDSESQTQREPTAEAADKPTAEAADTQTAEAEQTPPEDPQQEAQEQQANQARTPRVIRAQF